MLQTAIKLLSVPNRGRAKAGLISERKAALKAAKARGVWLGRHGACCYERVIVEVNALTCIGWPHKNFISGQDASLRENCD